MAILPYYLPRPCPDDGPHGPQELPVSGPVDLFPWFLKPISGRVWALATQKGLPTVHLLNLWFFPGWDYPLLSITSVCLPLSLPCPTALRSLNKCVDE